MKLNLGDEVVWEGTRFELIALDAATARLRAVDLGFVRVAMVSELLRDPDVQWPSPKRRRSVGAEADLLWALPEAQRKILLDVRSRTPLAAVLRAGGTNAADLVTVLARALTPL